MAADRNTWVSIRNVIVSWSLTKKPAHWLTLEAGITTVVNVPLLFLFLAFSQRLRFAKLVKGCPAVYAITDALTHLPVPALRVRSSAFLVGRPFRFRARN